MTKINIKFKNYIPEKYLKKNLKKNLLKNFVKTEKKISYQIKNQNNVYNILNKNFKFNFSLKQLQKFKKYRNICLVGMGGSILGSMAIYKFLQKKIKKNFAFIDNIDNEKLIEIQNKIKNKSTLFIVISKSGNTIETISNFFSLVKITNKQKNIIIISEKKNNTLFKLAANLKLFYVEHKRFIGGRYSVLSEVGMLPAYLMGLNISKIRKNLLRHFSKNSFKFLKDSVLKLANILQQKKINNIIFLNYAPQLEHFLFWCQQLIAESLGKNKKGFLPVVSNTPRDHHSLLQLYLDGPQDKLFQIFSLDENFKININSKKLLNKFTYLKNKSLSDIRLAQKEALIKTLIKKKIPYREFRIRKINEETLGELFSYFILETSIIGKITNINPFDQPAVEQVKLLTKSILK